MKRRRDRGELGPKGPTTTAARPEGFTAAAPLPRSARAVGLRWILQTPERWFTPPLPSKRHSDAPYSTPPAPSATGVPNSRQHSGQIATPVPGFASHCRVNTTRVVHSRQRWRISGTRVLNFTSHCRVNTTRVAHSRQRWRISGTRVLKSPLHWRVSGTRAATPMRPVLSPRHYSGTRRRLLRSRRRTRARSRMPTFAASANTHAPASLGVHHLARANAAQCAPGTGTAVLSVQPEKSPLCGGEEPRPAEARGARR